MIITLIGLVVAAIGLILLGVGTRLQMLCFVLFCGLFNGSATLIITALGSVSIQPALLAALFLVLRCALPGRRSAPVLGSALADNGWLLLLVGYSAIGAFLLPALFQGSIAVVPLRPSNNPLGLTAYPLRFSPQNITTAAYMSLTLVGAICAHMAVRRADAASRIARLASVIALAHVATGWSAAALRNTPLQAVFAFFRNGHYMQLDQDFGGMARLTGISPEPSLYASYGLIWFLFVTELWLRSVDRRWTGPAALALFLTLLASTSTTAYVGLAAYSAVLLIRQTFLVGTIPAGKGLVIAACLATLLATLLALVAGSDAVASGLARMLRLTTSDKLSSGSGVARLLWAKQGLTAFAASWGLGIGAGSFRSSQHPRRDPRVERDRRHRLAAALPAPRLPAHRADHLAPHRAGRAGRGLRRQLGRADEPRPRLGLRPVARSRPRLGPARRALAGPQAPRLRALSCCTAANPIRSGGTCR